MTLMLLFNRWDLADVAVVMIQQSVDHMIECVVFRQRMNAIFIQQSRLAAGRAFDAARDASVDGMRDQVVGRSAASGR